MACPESLGNPIRPRKVGRIVERLLFFFLGRKVPQKPVVVAERIETAVYRRLRKGTVEAGDVGSLLGVGEKHVLPQNHEGLHPSLAVGIRNLGPSVEEVVREVRFHALRVGYRPSEVGLRKHLRLQSVDLFDEELQFRLQPFLAELPPLLEEVLPVHRDRAEKPVDERLLVVYGVEERDAFARERPVA